jgi:predicted dienelactone hydrolase
MWFPRAAAAAAAAAAAPACRYDLILLSHGVSSSPDRYAVLAVHLASQGFVVLGPHHLDGASRGFDEGTERVDDLSYLLDHLDGVLQRLAPRLRGRVNGRAVGVAGHSFGAFTGAALTARDSRVKAAMIMAGGSDPSEAAAIKVPTLAVAGGADPLVPIERVRGFADAIPATTPHAFAVIAGAGHTAYGNRCVNFGTCAIVARTASAMFLTYLAGVPGASGPLEPPHPSPRVTITAVGMPPG